MPALNKKVIAQLSQRGLSTGATMGVILGTILGICAIVGLGGFICRRAMRQSKKKMRASQGGWRVESKVEPGVEVK